MGFLNALRIVSATLINSVEGESGCSEFGALLNVQITGNSYFCLVILGGNPPKKEDPGGFPPLGGIEYYRGETTVTIQ